MELTERPNSGEFESKSAIAAAIAKTELEKLNTPDTKIHLYPLGSSKVSEQSTNFKELPLEEQQAILKGLEAYQQGAFVTLDDYKNQQRKVDTKYCLP
ncbi:MAG TPA: hypothetical protein VK211_26870 [Kamptonema sp.]|nr:hypothetical protein [Kamptonema sp.]